MSFNTHTVEIGATISCDKPGCDTEQQCRYYPGPVSIDTSIDWDSQYAKSQEAELLRAQARAIFDLAGWTYWVGKRSTYTYCPEHKASSLSKSTIELDSGQRISAACYHDRHGHRCQRTMGISAYSRMNPCQCECHQEGGQP